MTQRRGRLALVPLLMSASAQGQAPLSIEQLMAKPARWQIIAAAVQRSASALDERRDRDVSLALRYGLGPRVEVNAALHRGRSSLRARGFSAEQSRDELSMGGTWLLHVEDRWPAVLLQLGANLPVSARDNGPAFGGEIAATLYRSIDPVVLSVSVGAARRAGFRDGSDRVSPGASWRIEPLVSFAVNPRVTLTGGLRWQRDGATRIDGRPLFSPRATTALSASVGYAPDLRNTVFVTGEVAAGFGGGSFGLQWYYQF